MSLLAQVNLHHVLAEEEFERQCAECQAALAELSHQLHVQKRPLVIVFEGWEAAGIGNAIRSLTLALDAREYAVYPMAVATPAKRAHHYLHRFWRRLPERGQVVIFDRSWYGRVLAERVEGLCPEGAWRRAYREINQFERQLADVGTIIVKFWLHIDQDEQLRRLQAREAAPQLAGPVTEADWRNREKWDQYEAAVEEMLLKTSTLTAPWTIVESNDLRWAQAKTLRTVVDTLARELKYMPDRGRAGAGQAGDKRRRPKGVPDATPEEATRMAKDDKQGDKKDKKNKKDKKDKKKDKKG